MVNTELMGVEGAHLGTLLSIYHALENSCVTLHLLDTSVPFFFFLIHEASWIMESTCWLCSGFFLVVTSYRMRHQNKKGLTLDLNLENIVIN